MVNQAIKSRTHACSVAHQLSKDIKTKLAIFNSYGAEVMELENQYTVNVFSTECCNIITEPAMEYIMKVKDMYEQLYETGSIMYSLTCRKDDTHNDIRPQVEFNIFWER